MARRRKPSPETGDSHHAAWRPLCPSPDETWLIERMNEQWRVNHRPLWTPLLVWHNGPSQQPRTYDHAMIVLREILQMFPRDIYRLRNVKTDDFIMAAILA